MSRRPGTFKGRIARSGSAQAGMQVEICAGYLGIMYFGDTPCSGQPRLMTTTTDSSGGFVFTGVPVGWYSLTFLPSGGTWMTLSSVYGLGSSQKLVSAGKATDVGTIDLAKGD